MDPVLFEDVLRQQARLPLIGDDPACLVKVDIQGGERLGPAPSLDDKGSLVSRPLHRCGIGALQRLIGGGDPQGGELRRIPQEGVGMTPHDHIDSRHGIGQFDILVVADMGQDDDLVDAEDRERRDRFGDAPRYIVEADRIAGGRGDGGIHGCHADDPHPLGAVLFDEVRRHFPGKGGFAGHIDICRKDGERGLCHEPPRHCSPLVELVIAEGHGIHAEIVEEVEIRIPLEDIEVEGALDRIAGMEEEHVSPRAPQFVQRRFQAGDATDFHAGVHSVDNEFFPFVIGRFQMGVGVIDMGNGQGQRLGLLAAAAACHQNDDTDDDNEPANRG